MQPDGFLSAEDTPTYVYALIGGVTGITVVIVHNLVVGAATYYSLNGAIIGCILAGFLARSGSGKAKKAGMGAGVLGMLPAFAWLSEALREFFISFVSETGAIFAFVVLSLLLLVTFTWAAVMGAFGGFCGGWIAGKVNPDIGG